MAEHVWTVLCDQVITDRNSNRASIISVCEKLIIRASFEDLRGKEKEVGAPLALPVQLDLLCWWVRSNYDVPEERKGRIRLVSPDDTELVTNYDIPLMEATGWRPTIKFESFPITHGPGLYWIENQLMESEGDSWSTKARLPIVVEFRGNSSQPKKKGQRKKDKKS